MVTYEPGSSLAHGFDPRAKLAFQIGIAAAAFSRGSLRGLAAVALVALAALAAARLSPVRALVAFRFPLLLLALSPAIAAVRLGPPWVDPAAAAEAAFASARVVPVLLVSAAYVRTTPVRESRAALQRVVPGKAGRVLGAGTAITVRFFPVLLADLRRIREAMAARLGEERPLRDRMRIVATAGVARAFTRADRLSLALRARCFAWNPTLPALRFRRRDAALCLVAGALALSPLI
ncbi:energy-coupling factor transporter transmembrane protein EcfT [Halostella sp. JP-L12]|uniref:energy-coupling factor transporter transmembrane component T family protein n=1 Tax=Halostella TaxID=1843185 RepID=UPI000EF835A6|nr:MULTISPECIES: energy-coupling factor transporter transmembrane component T [Halostella]NHN46122.1 energy-coupling factor transporter transmembrane protein EcfT [Halostella sp. JP-L12]